MYVYEKIHEFCHRKNQMKRVCQVPAEALSSDMWSWRKYGQKPIKGSPYPRLVPVIYIYIHHEQLFFFFFIRSKSIYVAWHLPELFVENEERKG